MGLVGLASAKGSPGVSCLAVLLARCWSGPVLLVEADPAGGDLAARLGLAGEPNVTTLAIRARTGIDADDIWDHTQHLAPRGPRGGSSPRIVTGSVGPDEGRSLRPAWTALVSALRQLPATVLVDLGRCSPGEPLFQAVAPCADTAVVVVRADLAAVSHARALATSWPPGVTPGIVVVGDTPYRPHDVARVTGLELLGAVPHNRNAAEAELLGQWGPGGRSLRRSVARLAGTLAARCRTVEAAPPVPDGSAPARVPVGAEPPTTEEAGG